MLQSGKLDLEFGFVLVFFHRPSMQPWVPVESSGHVGIEDASELHLRLQEVDNDQDAVKMNRTPKETLK